MFRKLALAVAAIAALGTAGLSVSTTPAEAKKGGWHGHHHHKHWHGGYRFHRGPYYASYGYSGCYVKRVFYTQWGPRVRWVNVCY